MEEPPVDQSMDAKTLISFYTKSIWNRLLRFLPSSESNILGKFSNIYHRTTRATSRRRTISLPLPLPSNSTDTYMVMPEACKVLDVLEDILEHVFQNLHYIQKNLQFWQLRAEGSSAQKVYFMIFERGPRAFIDGTVQFVRDCVNEGSGMHHLYGSASTHISERITILSKLRFALATFLAQVYMEVEGFGEELVKDPEKSLPLLLTTVDDLFSKLEASIGHIHAMRRCAKHQKKNKSEIIFVTCVLNYQKKNSLSVLTLQKDSSVDGNYSFPLMFEKLPEVNQEGSQWTDCEITDSINLIYKNLHKLDSYLSLLVAEHRKPRKATLYWMRYTCGVVGLSVCSIWLLKHSRLTGSPDIENWIREAKDSTVSFWSGHVEQPLLSIRDELFETFRTRHRGVMDFEEVQLTASSLHRMLLTFSEQTKGQKFPENASDQEMLEIVMARYEKELMHPIQNLVGGELVRALLIQIQKLKLDIETAMLELNQILRANEINFAILAALPAFFLSFGILMLVRAWFKKDTRAEGRGRIARLQRRLLIVEVEKRIMQFQNFTDKGLEKDAQCMFGLVLYSLDRLYRALERHAKATGEWQCLKQDIMDLGKTGIKTSYKLTVTSRMVNVYDCLLPSPKRQ